MLLVKRNAKELAAGYAALESFQLRLKTEWEPRFLRLHLEKQKQYQIVRRQYNNRPWYERIFVHPPNRPKLIRFSTLYDKYYWPVRLQWHNALASTPAAEIPILPTDKPGVKFGKKGERKMLHWLAARLDDRYVAACRLHTKKLDKADIDVIIAGPKGYWYFEVKNWKGAIYGEGDQKWLHVTKFGEEQEKDSPIWVWKRVAKEISQLLRPVWQNPFTQSSVVRAGGGVVFTTEPSECELNIKDRSRVKLGHLSTYWEAELRSAPILKDATPQLMFQIIDALLTKNQSLEQPHNTFSTAVTAKKLIHQAENNIKNLFTTQSR